MEPNDVVPSPDQVTSQKDRGDDVQLRFDYQAKCAALICLTMVRGDKIKEVYCELHEDVLVKQTNGEFVGVQIKTRNLDLRPFRSTDTEIVGSIRRFVEHETMFPGKFVRHVIATNYDFQSGEDKYSLPYILGIAQNGPSSPEERAVLDEYIEVLTKKRAEGAKRNDPRTIVLLDISSEALINILKKIQLSVEYPKFADADAALSDEIRKTGPYDELKARTVEKLAMALWSATEAAASKKVERSLEIYFSGEDDPAAARAKLLIEGKRITKEDVETLCVDIIERNEPEFLLARDPQQERIATLFDLKRKSKGRCISRWKAIGVSLMEASSMADDTAIGTPPAGAVPTVEKPFVLLVGSVGSGKSLIAERLHQNAIELAISNGRSPIPVYIRSSELNGSLEQLIEQRCEGIGRLREVGASVIIDGLDESTIPPENTIDDARSIVHFWPNTTFVITSRDLPGLAKAEEKVYVEDLVAQAVFSLISRFAGQEISHRWEGLWPEPIRDAIRRPMFAILLGLYLQETGGVSPRSVGEMFSSLVDYTLRGLQPTTLGIRRTLQRLAVSLTFYGNSLIPVSESGLDQAELDQVEMTGFVTRERYLIGFSLPILLHWFAADGIENGLVDPAKVASAIQILEGWRYPLMIAIGLFSHEKVTRFLHPIVTSYPGYAGELIDAGSKEIRFGVDAPDPLPPASVCGHRIQETLGYWVEGLQPLAPKVAPVRKDGTLAPLGIRVNEGSLELSRYFGNDRVDDVVDFPANPFAEGWSGFHGLIPAQQASWAWKVSFDEVSEGISKLLQARGLTVEGGILVEEGIWLSAIHLMGLGRFRSAPIPTKELNDRIRALPNKFRVNNRKFLYLQQLVNRVIELQEDVGNFICSPWPGPDLDHQGQPWQEYSQERLIERVNAIYCGAIECYKSLVDQWFPNFRANLITYSKLPVRVVGALECFPDNSRYPRLSYYMEPLPEREVSQTQISISEKLFDIEDIPRTPRPVRPKSFPSARSSAIWHMNTAHLFYPDPATEIAYGWLWDDLDELGWVSGVLPYVY